MLTNSYITLCSKKLQIKKGHLTHLNVPVKSFKNDGSIYQINLLKICENVLKLNVVRFESKEVRSYYIKSKLKGVGFTSKVFLRKKEAEVREVYEWGIGDREKEVIKFEVYGYTGISHNLTGDIFVGSGYLNAGADSARVSIVKNGVEVAGLEVECEVEGREEEERRGFGKLNVFIYRSSVTDGHLAALDMKIGSRIGVKWWNRVSLSVTPSPHVKSTVLRKKDVKGNENKTVFNELVRIEDVDCRGEEILRIIVHQKALYDLNERAVGAVTYRIKDVPVFREGEEVKIPLPERGEGKEVMIKEGTPLDIFSSARVESATALRGEERGTLFHDGGIFGGMKVPGFEKAKDALGEFLEFLSPSSFEDTAQDLDPSAPVPSSYNLQPLHLPLSTLAAVGQNRLISNGRLKVVMWITSAPKSPMGTPVPHVSPEKVNVPLNFPEPRANELVDKVVDYGFKRVRRALTSSGSDFMKAHYGNMKYKDVRVTGWRMGEVEFELLGSPEWGFEGGGGEGGPLAERTVEYVMPKSIMVKANRVRECWRLMLYEENGFVVEIVTETPEVPFGGSFTTNVRICVEGRGRKCWVGVSSEAVFGGRRPIVAGQIENGVRKGTKGCYKKMMELMEGGGREEGGGRRQAWTGRVEEEEVQGWKKNCRLWVGLGVGLGVVVEAFKRGLLVGALRIVLQGLVEFALFLLEKLE
ncbi:hypothetical protein TrVE_jg8568 [Triparma verrucosa]|uniref:VASt domain-containing protein n=1 Tax=Triparma verrucosa TaxID=1606542 RepID=A0A9W7FG65_9STRA|nr:hypothetical protein TrVE_jg8568 [Triparma verrucosa]